LRDTFSGRKQNGFAFGFGPIERTFLRQVLERFFLALDYPALGYGISSNFHFLGLVCYAFLRFRKKFLKAGKSISFFEALPNERFPIIPWDQYRERDASGSVFRRVAIVKATQASMLFSTNVNADIEFMRQALAEARESGASGEVPVGAVLVHEGRILARAGNRTIRDCDPTAHAEIVALREAARIVGNYRLTDTTLYVTIEPCSMCAGAMIQARVPRLVYGAAEPRGGAVQSCFEVLSHPELNHRVQVTSGVLGSECSEALQSFFAVRRQQARQ